MDGSLRATPAAAWLRLVQAVSHCGRQLRRALAERGQPLGLSDTDCLILWACCEGRHEGQSQHELAALVGVSPAQLCGVVDRLARSGWMVGRRPAHDRRRQYWRLTAEGEALVEQLLADVADWCQTTGSSHSDAEHSGLLSHLARISATLTSATGAQRKEAA